MSIDREAIWNALYQRLKAQCPCFVTVSRKHADPAKLTSHLQPALFVVQAMEDKTGGPYGTGGSDVLHGFLMVYDVDRTPDEPIGAETEFMVTKLNGYLKAIEDALDPKPYDTQNLGLPWVVEHCWIQGTTTIDQGILGKQAFILIPIHIQVA